MMVGGEIEILIHVGGFPIHSCFCATILIYMGTCSPVVELWDSNSHGTQEHMERESKESKLGDRALSVLSAFTLFTVYSYKVVFKFIPLWSLFIPPQIRLQVVENPKFRRTHHASYN